MSAISASGAYIELGQYLIDQKKYDEAERLFKKAIKVNPKKDWGYEQLAKIYLLKGRVDDAEKVFTRSLKSNAKRAWAYASLCRFYRDQHRMKEAEDVLLDGIKKHSDAMDIYIELGDLYVRQRRSDEAIKILQEALRRDPNNSRLHVQMGFALGEQKRFDDMEGMFDQAAKLDSLNIYLDLSDWYLKHHEFVRAEVFLQKVLTVHPDEGRILRGMANVYAEIGRKDKAREYQLKAETLLAQRPLESTMKNYRKIVEIVQSRGISMAAITYATREVTSLKQMLNGIEGIAFVNNSEVFKKALAEGRYEDYFTDTFAGDFGHCTPKGAHLLAENVAKVIE